MNSLPRDDALLLATLRAAGREAVARKQLLGQYAVVWRDGAPVFIGPNPPAVPGGYPLQGEMSRPPRVAEPRPGKA